MWFKPVENDENKCLFKVQYKIIPLPGGLNTWIARKVCEKMNEVENKWKKFMETDIERFKKEKAQKQ